MDALPESVLFTIAEKLEWTSLRNFLMLCQRCRKAASGIALKRKRQLIGIVRNWSIRTLPPDPTRSRAAHSVLTRQQCLEIMTREKDYEVFLRYLWSAFVPSLSISSKLIQSGGVPVAGQLRVRASSLLTRHIPIVYDMFTSADQYMFMDLSKNLPMHLKRSFLSLSLEAVAGLYLAQLQFACLLPRETVDALFDAIGAEVAYTLLKYGSLTVP